MEAYCNQIADFGEDFDSNNRATAVKVDMNRVRAGIVDEFEKARAEYDAALTRAQLASKTKLLERKKNRRNGDSGTNVAEETVEGLTLL
jgi:hypothetical protein